MRGIGSEAAGQVAKSTVARVATYTDGSSLIPPSSVLRLRISCRVPSGLSACSPVAMEFQQVDLLVGIEN